MLTSLILPGGFGALRHLPVRDRVVGQSWGLPVLPKDYPTSWSIELEVARPDLLSEHGRVQSSSVDVLLRTWHAVVCSVFQMDGLFIQTSSYHSQSHHLSCPT